VLRAAGSEGRPAVWGDRDRRSVIGLIRLVCAARPRAGSPFATMAELLARWHRAMEEIPEAPMAGADSPGRLAVLQLALAAGAETPAPSVAPARVGNRAIF